LNIFFILTTQFIRPAGTTMEIPSGSTDPAKKQETMLTINVSADKIFFGEKSEEVTLEGLRERLLKENLAARPEHQRIVVVDSGRDVPYERYFQVITSVANAHGVIALVEDEGQGGGERSEGQP
jgi:biopolymer transport protein ExbD